MQKLTIIFFLAFACNCLKAQINLDSLYRVWQDETYSISNRAEALGNYIEFRFIESKSDSALLLIPKLMEFGNTHDYPAAKAIGNTLMGDYYYYTNNHELSLEFHDKAVIIWEELSDDQNLSKNLGSIAYILEEQGNFPKAIEYNKKLQQVYQKTNDTINIISGANDIGVLYGFLGNYSKALDYYTLSSKLSEHLEDKSFYEYSLFNIGMVYYEQEDYVKALEYLDESLKIEEKSGDMHGLVLSLISVGSIYVQLGNLESALELTERALGISENTKNKELIASSLSSLGVIYSEKNKLSLSLAYHKRALEIYEESDDLDMMDSKIQIEIANNEFDIGGIYKRQGNFRKSLVHCLKSLSIAEKMDDIVIQKNACECLYETYKALDNGNKALAYHEQMLVLNDSLQTEETSKKLQQIEFNKQILADSLLQVEKDLKVEMAHQTEVRKKDKNKNIALGVGTFFLLLAGGFYSRWRYVKKSKATLEKEKDRSENLLLNILPSEIAEELKAKGSAEARNFDLVSILFTDFKGFTQASEKLSAKELIEEINVCFKAFDTICETYGIEKIKTIGDAYMAAGGLPVPSKDSIKNTVLAALKMQSFISNRIIEKDELDEISFKMRVGIHTGPVVAGIVGIKKFQYDIWGDTVNTASRMESSGKIGKVNISEGTYALLKDDPEFVFESRGKIEAKGKGEIEMYFVKTKLK